MEHEKLKVFSAASSQSLDSFILPQLVQARLPV